MTTKKHEDDKHPAKPDEPQPDTGSEHRRPQTPPRSRTATDDPMATPTWDVHAPNPPSEGEK